MMPQFNLLMAIEKIKNMLSDDKYEIKQVATEFENFSKLAGKLPPTVAQACLPILAIAFFEIHSKKFLIKRFNENQKLCIINTLEEILKKTKIDDVNAFYVLLDFLLTILVNPNTPTLPDSSLSEEIKIAVMKCLHSLYCSMSMDIYLQAFTEKYFNHICHLLYVCIHLAKNEKAKHLQLAALECIMYALKVDDNSEDDIVLYAQIAPIIIKVLPGVVTKMIQICVDDDKCGHQIVIACIKGWGRLVSVAMRSYESSETPKLPMLNELFKVKDEKDETVVHDKHIAVCCNLLKRLTTHSHEKVRIELISSCKLLINTCFYKLPQTTVKATEMLIILSEDDYNIVVESALTVLKTVHDEILKEDYRVSGILDDLQRSFYKHLTNLPTVFNGVDSHEQIAQMNLLAGYLKLFANSSKLKNILFTQVNLTRLMGSLLLIAEIDKKNVSLLEEYALHDWNSSPDQRTPWKTFKFSNKCIQNKLEHACYTLVQPTVIDIVLDYLLDIFHNDQEQRTEATLLINEIMSVKSPLITWRRAKEILNLYLDSKYWNLPVAVEGKIVLRDVQRNIIQLCIQLEGIGKISLSVGKEFHLLMLKVLYHVLEKAGSSHPLLRAAGLSSIANISLACGYKSITHLINENSDYFTHHVVNKLRRPSENEAALTVLAVVMNYSDIEVLDSISNITEGVLMQSCDKFQEKNAAAYLRIFAVFMKSMHRWMNIRIVEDPIIPRAEKERQRELEYKQRMEELHKPIDLSDNVMGKTAEQLYNEDNQENNDLLDDYDESEMEEYKKPEPPRHIKLVILILERALNFLPAKEVNRKILVLEILNSGLDIIRDYEDELLPIVHKIWSPLINRFKEFEVPLIINLSFNLLKILGRLSKDFIRMRTIKDVLPTIREILLKQSKESYLKDRGSAYRYTQAYKMQLNILENIGRLVYDLDIGKSIDNALDDCVAVYLNNKQPIPLQDAAMSFYKTIYYFDPQLGSELINNISEKLKCQSGFATNLNSLMATI